jgi:tellurium resistance protein TerD
MGVSLSKGGNVSLSKMEPNLTAITVGLGWDARATDGQDFDLDASAFLLGANGKVANDTDFIFYNNMKSANGAVEHTGDNRTGAGDGDDESININLVTVPVTVDKIAVTVTIHDAMGRKQNFGMVQGAFIRIINSASNVELAKFDLSEDFSTETAVVFGEVYRHGAEWKFRAVGQGFAGGLDPMARNYGVSIG